MKKYILFQMLVFVVLAATRPIDLYYTEDGKNVKMLRGYPLNSDFTISENGDESWLISVGQRIGPNGFMGRDNKMSFGTLGKSKSVFTVSQDEFLGIGKGLNYSNQIFMNDIAYILPDSITLAPFFVTLRTGETGTLFVANQPTESPGLKTVAGNVVNDFTIIHLKYDVPRNKRGPGVIPKQMGIKARAASFSETGIKQAINAFNN